ncbi:hypothetical protein CLIB1444_02S10418 [[Candida] jaroonii]|uniref:Uncharacterized protein n=1 Tax=[Candida] jaroonii TaxID=467808 RepID=A0ACA9Y4D0_9ASCO|nr:hypothetical protein CLIB1444_02S10418 [[Candida] jaroonii]
MKDGDSDKSYRFFLRKRDSHSSSTSSLISSVGSNSSNSDEKKKKRSHLSLTRFLKKFKHEEKEEKKRLHFLPPHSSELYKKYTKGRLLGSGASGSVNLLQLKTDPTKIFAVKKFRSKLPNESESDYKVKVNNEFKIGEILHHENLIHTIELIKESNGILSNIEYYIIMEYCKYDFFNLVMSRLMTSEEVHCYFKQIINGVEYLHSIGLAHRDLKLDNCVVNSQGILKLIDFGSAVQFRKSSTHEDLTPDETIIVGESKYKLILSKGVVGSDPYLAPEVFDEEGYDGRKVDVWSIAIIYCCMILRRFPWKLPKTSDNSYKQFIQDDRKLLALLPENSRSMIKRMLDTKDKRILLDEVKQHEFYEKIEYCTTGNSLHQHNLVTEEELEQINKEREVLKKLKNTGIA